MNRYEPKFDSPNYLRCTSTNAKFNRNPITSLGDQTYGWKDSHGFLTLSVHFKHLVQAIQCSKHNLYQASDVGSLCCKVMECQRSQVLGVIMTNCRSNILQF
jgi:hypothetical protein